MGECQVRRKVIRGLASWCVWIPNCPTRPQLTTTLPASFHSPYFQSTPAQAGPNNSWLAISLPRWSSRPSSLTTRWSGHSPSFTPMNRFPVGDAECPPRVFFSMGLGTGRERRLGRPFFSFRKQIPPLSTPWSTYSRTRNTDNVFVKSNPRVAKRWLL